MRSKIYLDAPKKTVKKNLYITSDQQKMLKELSTYFDKKEYDLLREMIETEWINHFWDLYRKDDICGE